MLLFCLIETKILFIFKTEKCCVINKISILITPQYHMQFYYFLLYTATEQMFLKMLNQK